MKQRLSILLAVIILISSIFSYPLKVKGVSIDNNASGGNFSSAIDGDSSLRIIDISPAPGTQDLPANAPIKVKFSKNIEKSGFFSSIDLHSYKDPAIRTSSGSIKTIKGDTLYIYPLGKSAYDSTLELMLFGGESYGAVKDEQGNEFPKSITSFKFNVEKEFTRLSGKDRYETSIKISQKGWKSADTVILATGRDFPDALSAGPLAKKYNAPILLSESHELDPAIENEIDRLNAGKVFIIGGTGAVSSNIEQRLKSKGITVERIGGQDRYETSMKIAGYVGISPDKNTCILVTGYSFPDALSISSYASANGMPIILTEKDRLPKGFVEFMNNYGPNSKPKVYVIGGTGVISTALEDSLPFEHQRLGGKDRYETNIELLLNLEFDYSNVFFATGGDFPDALSGSVMAAMYQAPVILVGGHMTEDSIKTLQYNNETYVMKYILGGEGVVPQSIIDTIFKGFGTAGSAVKADIPSSKSSNTSDVYGDSNSKQIADRGISNISYIHNWIFYIGPDAKVYRLRRDGNDRSAFINENTKYLYATNNWVYYYSDALYRVRPDGALKTKIVETDNPQYFAIRQGQGDFEEFKHGYARKDHIYFLDNSKLYRIDSDGLNKTLIIDDAINTFELPYLPYLGSDNGTVYGYNPGIYYVTKNNALYRSRLDGSHKLPVTSDKVKDVISDGSFIYFINMSDNNSLYRIDNPALLKLTATKISTINGNNMSNKYISFMRKEITREYPLIEEKKQLGKILNNDLAVSLKYKDGWFYYVNMSDNNKIYRSWIYGFSNAASLDVASSGEIEVSGDYIYYSNLNDNKKLYRIKTDGTDNVKVLDIAVNEVKVSEDSIYYIDTSDQKVYKTNIDGAGQVRLSSRKARDLIVKGEWAYYFHEGTSGPYEAHFNTGCGIYKVKNDGSSESIFDYNYILDMAASDKYLYFYPVGDYAGFPDYEEEHLRLSSKDFETAKYSSPTPYAYDDEKYAVNQIRRNYVDALNDEELFGTKKYHPLFNTSLELYYVKTDVYGSKKISKLNQRVFKNKLPWM